jgi:hypothetical protein
MDPNGPIAQRFPLIARPRPPSTALRARISTLAALADAAVRDRDPTIAARVHNQAALIASDCGQPDLARTWCHRHARTYPHDQPADAHTARQALEPLVNLARLHIRAGHGETALALIDTLYHAISTRTDTVIDGIPVPAATLTRTPEDHTELSRWLWAVHLADGTRALTATGRWHDAEARLQQHNGIGQRMLDGRQVAVITRIVRGDHAEAIHLLAATQPGQPWEIALTTCLTALAQTATPVTDAHLTTLIEQYHQLQPDLSLTLFRARLALTIIDAIGDTHHPSAQTMAHDLIRAVLDSRDGYAARDLVSHHPCALLATPEQAEELTTVIRHAGLGRRLPPLLTSRLEAVLATSEAVISRQIPRRCVHGDLKPSV